jgi:hypothetical protein
MSVVDGMNNPAVQQYLHKSRSLLRNQKLVLREGEASTFEWTPLVIAGVVVGSLLVLALLWVLYRYMIWKPRMKARRAGPLSPGSKTTAESSEPEPTSAETKRLFAAIKMK